MLIGPEFRFSLRTVGGMGLCIATPKRIEQLDTWKRYEKIFPKISEKEVKNHHEIELFLLFLKNHVFGIFFVAVNCLLPTRIIGISPHRKTPEKPLANDSALALIRQPHEKS
jgi:hypothetical protein